MYLDEKLYFKVREKRVRLAPKLKVGKFHFLDNIHHTSEIDFGKLLIEIKVHIFFYSYVTLFPFSHCVTCEKFTKLLYLISRTSKNKEIIKIDYSKSNLNVKCT